MSAFAVLRKSLKYPKSKTRVGAGDTVAREQRASVPPLIQVWIEWA